MKTEVIQFSAVIKQDGNMNAAFVEFPFSTEKLFGTKRPGKDQSGV
ncbi:hypothetical protein HNP38_002118 [Chryseobacterium defluvii]|uniref:Uncharacterized protein n=1 Tax=Chryseobacterium defluvii TaxID=160396 RepID=A0A840KIW1_9FLAO|nr:hypothetical protein [Chryseobacterium defluvii]MBB4806822.1 hypothetical protein [Chryseobacterium defluvii]